MMMKKRFLSLLLALSMTLGLSAPTLAADENQSNLGAIDASEMVGILTADDGTEYVVQGTLVDVNNTVSAFSLGESETALTYKFSIPASVFSGGGSNWESGQDTNSLTEAFLTVHYSTRAVQEPGVSDMFNEYLLTRITGYWSENSPNVTVDHGVLEYRCYMGDDPLAEQQTGTKTVSNYFDVSTGFSRYVYSSIAVFGAILTVHVTMGSRNWTFKVINNPSVG